MGLRGVEGEIQRLDHAKTKTDLGQSYIYITANGEGSRFCLENIYEY